MSTKSSHTVRITHGLQTMLAQERRNGESYGAVLERLVAESRPDIEARGNPGRGKRFCPNCGEAVGIRTKQCSCGEDLPQPQRPKISQRQLRCEVLEDRRLLSSMPIRNAGALGMSVIAVGCCVDFDQDD